MDQVEESFIVGDNITKIHNDQGNNLMYNPEKKNVKELG